MFCLANCCRLCLSKDNTLVDYNVCAEDNVSYFQKLMNIAPQLLAEAKIYYPTEICKQCQKQLNEAYIFLQQCFKSKKLLLTYITQLNESINNSYHNNLTNTNELEPYIFAEVPNYSSNSGLVKAEIDIDDAMVLPDFESTVVDTESQNPLLDTAESVSFNACIKQEEFNSGYISDHNLHTSEFVFAAVKSEPQNVEVDENYSVSLEKEEESDNEDDLGSDAPTSPDEFEPIRKNEKTPRLKRYKCLKCTKKFSRYSHLLRHSRVHTGKRPFPCTTCNKSFSQLENLERHQLIHSDIKPHTCTACGKSFRDKSYFKKHIQLHEGKRYTCDVCGKAYTNSRNLIVHNRKHTGERPFECSICKNKYADPDTLRKHKKKCETKISHDTKCQEIEIEKNTTQAEK